MQMEGVKRTVSTWHLVTREQLGESEKQDQLDVACHLLRNDDMSGPVHFPKVSLLGING